MAIKVQVHEGFITGCGCEVIAANRDGVVIRHWEDTCKNKRHGCERVELFNGQCVISSPKNDEVAVYDVLKPYPNEMPGWGYQA